MDPNIGRLQAALASATNEITVAAANLNFDFSIVKYEAPKEFHPVGQLLSTKRKYEAEDGSCHTIARRLAALFAGVCPNSPELIKAYGQRASEIAREATSKVSKEHFASVFSQYTGVDATSMWAAATSSKDTDGSAIQVHLLACLLASMWDAPEAISIWVQMVAERRSEIALQAQRGEEVKFSTFAAAAQQEIPRNQLADWDASARSWLETADEIKKKEQAQLRVILKNIEFSVSPQPTVYKNVVEVWKTAITTIDNLVSGIAQESYAGSTMIGLSAWHLYPDMHVFGRKNVEVKMSDPLIPTGGILSLNCSPSATTPKSGITWSLSLANLKFYGDPIETTASMQGDLSRLTVREFRLALLGCILRIWNIAPMQEAITVRLLAALSLTLLDQARKEWTLPFSKLKNWKYNYLYAFTLLEQAEAHYRDDELGSSAFINLGRNRPQFRPRQDKHTNFGCRPFFGLLDSRNFLESLRSPEDRVSALQRCGSRVGKLRSFPAIIRYKTAENRVQYTALIDNTNTVSTLGSTGGPSEPMRWLDPDLTIPVTPMTQCGDADGGGDRNNSDELDCNEGNNSSHGANKDDEYGKEGTDKSKSKNDNDRDNILYAAFGSMNLEDDDNEQDGNQESYGEDDDEDKDDDEDEDDDKQFASSTALLFESKGLPYQFYFGDADKAAIFVPVGYHDTCTPFFTAEDILWALEHHSLMWDGSGFITTDAMVPWLSLFEYALRCLQELPGPVISVQTLKQTHFDPNWAENLEANYMPRAKSPFHTWNPTTAEILSVLAYFLGGCDIGSPALESTTGISYGNSIYVPTNVGL